MTGDEVCAWLANDSLTKADAGQLDAIVRQSLRKFIQDVIDDKSIPRARVRDEIEARLRVIYGLD